MLKLLDTCDQTWYSSFYTPKVNMKSICLMLSFLLCPVSHKLPKQACGNAISILWKSEPPFSELTSENRSRELAHLAAIYIHRFLSKFSENLGVISKCDINTLSYLAPDFTQLTLYIFKHLCPVLLLFQWDRFFLFMAVTSDWWLLKQAAWACHPNANTASLLTCKRLNHS